MLLLWVITYYYNCMTKLIRRKNLEITMRDIYAKREAYKNAAKITKSEIIEAHYNGFEECLALIEGRESELLGATSVSNKQKLVRE